MNFKYRALSVFLTLLLLFTCCACSLGSRSTGASTEEEAVDSVSLLPQVEVDAASLPQTLTIVCDGLTGEYDPLYASEEGDLAVARLTGISLLTLDTGGAFLYSAASAGVQWAAADITVAAEETMAIYTITLREELAYTATMLEELYMQLLSLDYTGPREVAQVPIAGLEEYWSGVSAADTETYGAEFDFGPDTQLYAECMQSAWYQALETMAEECYAAAQTQAVDTFDIPTTDRSYLVALTMAVRGFGEVDSTGTMTGLATGRTWSLSGDDLPDWDDFYAECTACYLGDADAFSQLELGDANALRAIARTLYIAACAQQAGTYGTVGISGIQVVDDQTLRITVESGDLRYVYQLFDVILPDVGPYTLAWSSSDTVMLQGNGDWFAGAPSVDILYLQATGEGDIDATGQGSGTVTLSQTTGRFGYIAINAQSVLVGEEAGSSQSTALREALLLLLSACRERTVATYFGEDAIVCNVPTASENWTAPAQWEYPESGEEALEQAKALLQEAGYTWDATTGAFTAAPEGASMTYTMLIPGGGTGSHPAYTLAKQAAALFSQLGLKLEVEDVDSETFWQRLEDGQMELWAAAWQESAATDPSRWYSLCGLSDTYLSVSQAALSAGTASAYQSAYALLYSWQVVLPFYETCETVTFSEELPVYPELLTLDYDWVSWLMDLVSA